MRVLGIDWGESRVGLAVSDETGTIASPYRVVRNDATLMASLRRAVAEVGAAEIVIGYPLTLTGEEGPAVETVHAFARELQQGLALPVKLVDERFTTKAAEEKLRAAGVKARRIPKTADAAAAALILQTYLDIMKKAARD
jgi:putative Holliday junction resolvase